jgi:hypothetical protein
MPDFNRSLIQCVAAAALLSVAPAVPAAAQQATAAPQPTMAQPPSTAQPPGPAPDSGPGFMTRYDFHLSAASLAINDQRFSWDTHFGGEVDVVDYVVGRASVVVDYEAVLGDQFRAFDPNQGVYTLETSGSVRIGGTELVGVFHHVSRHLSDRAKRFPIAWNIVGARVLRRLSVSDTTFDLKVEAGHVTQHSFVDYQWVGQLDILIRRPLTPHVGLLAHATGQLFGVDSSVVNRSDQTGGLAEIGVRLNGRAGAIELFVGLERRVDADPLDRLPQQWALAGFRLLGR